MSSERPVLIMPDTKIGAILDAYPGLEPALIELVPVFEKLRNPVLRSTVAKVATVERAAGIAGIPTRELVLRLRAAAGQPSDENDQSANPASTACGCFSPEHHPRTEASVEGGGPAGSETAPAWLDDSRVTEIIDARALLAEGEPPLGRVVLAAKTLAPRSILRILVDFRPTPMIDVLQQHGYHTFCRKLEDTAYELFVASSARL